MNQLRPTSRKLVDEVIKALADIESDDENIVIRLMAVPLVATREATALVLRFL